MRIPLTRGKFAIIDDEDYEKVYHRSWHYTDGGYAFSGLSTKEKSIYMHRLIMGLSYKDGLSVDHINGDRLDNRKCNLRLVTQVQNNGNQKTPSDNTSGYKGVSWHKRDKKWRVQIQHEGKLVHIGYYSCVEDAAKAYDEKAIELFGEFARTNYVYKT